MCSRVECPSCSKPTWAGCGRHVEQALAGVPKEQRCRCRESAQKSPATQAPQQPAGLFSLFRK